MKRKSQKKQPPTKQKRYRNMLLRTARFFNEMSIQSHSQVRYRSGDGVWTPEHLWSDFGDLQVAIDKLLKELK